VKRVRQVLFRIFSQMFVLIFFFFTLIAGRSETTWVWGDLAGVDIKSTLRILTLHGWPDLSFVRLAKYRSVLSIELVQKGTNWTPNASFCSRLLPSAIKQFLEIHDIDLLSEVDTMDVFNASDPYIAGCKCYTRTMFSMGFDTVHGTRFTSQSEIDNFCATRSPHSRLLVGVPSNNRLVHIPLTDPDSDTLLLFADHVDNIYDVFQRNISD
jgi:hypothetical protein